MSKPQAESAFERLCSVCWCNTCTSGKTHLAPVVNSARLCVQARKDTSYVYAYLDMQTRQHAARLETGLDALSVLLLCDSLSLILVLAPHSDV